MRRETGSESTVHEQEETPPACFGGYGQDHLFEDPLLVFSS